MENRVQLEVVAQSGNSTTVLDVARVWNGGWAGRNQADVQKHIDELVAHGVPAPKVTPIYFPLSNNNLTTSDAIQVISAETSGEVEYVLLFTEQGTYVGVASDHSDRGFEKFGIQLSKQLYPNVMAPRVWPLEEVQPHWDRIHMSCWVTKDGERQLYQQITLAELLSIEQWLGIIRPVGIPAPGTVFLSGTPSTLKGLVFGDRFEIELRDPVLGRAISHEYEVQVLPTGVH